jgi:hypothetical protein
MTSNFSLAGQAGSAVSPAPHLSLRSLATGLDHWRYRLIWVTVADALPTDH